jgi:hypothetical protein
VRETSNALATRNALAEIGVTRVIGSSIGPTTSAESVPPSSMTLRSCVSSGLLVVEKYDANVSRHPSGGVYVAASIAAALSPALDTYLPPTTSAIPSGMAHGVSSGTR